MKRTVYSVTHHRGVNDGEEYSLIKIRYANDKNRFNDELCLHYHNNVTSLLFHGFSYESYRSMSIHLKSPARKTVRNAIGFILKTFENVPDFKEEQ